MTAYVEDAEITEVWGGQKLNLRCAACRRAIKEIKTCASDSRAARCRKVGKANKAGGFDKRAVGAGVVTELYTGGIVNEDEHAASSGFIQECYKGEIVVVDSRAASSGFIEECYTGENVVVVDSRAASSGVVQKGRIAFVQNAGVARSRYVGEKYLSLVFRSVNGSDKVLCDARII